MKYIHVCLFADRTSKGSWTSSTSPCRRTANTIGWREKRVRRVGDTGVKCVTGSITFSFCIISECKKKYILEICLRHYLWFLFSGTSLYKKHSRLQLQRQPRNTVQRKTAEQHLPGTFFCVSHFFRKFWCFVFFFFPWFDLFSFFSFFLLICRDYEEYRCWCIVARKQSFKRSFHSQYTSSLKKI